MDRMGRLQDGSIIFKYTQQSCVLIGKQFRLYWVPPARPYMKDDLRRNATGRMQSPGFLFGSQRFNAVFTSPYDW